MGTEDNVIQSVELKLSATPLPPHPPNHLQTSILFPTLNPQMLGKPRRTPKSTIRIINRMTADD